MKDNRVRQWWARWQESDIAKRLRPLQGVAGLATIVVLAVILSPRARDGTNIFLTTANLTDILRQVSEIGIMAIAMTFVILSAGIDLSVGTLLALSATVTAKVLVDWDSGWPPGMHMAAAGAAGLGVCTIAGALNGFVIAQFRIQPFIVTLAAMIGLRGLARRLTNNYNIDIGFGDGVAPAFCNLVGNRWIVIGCYAVLALLLGWVLAKTVFGRHVRAMGDNATAALYAGLPVKRLQIAVYALSGAMAGLAGVLHVAQNRQGNPNDGIAYELDVIAAVVIGGASLSGGKGHVWGTLVGVLIMGVLTNLFRLRGIDINVEMMVKAVIIIAAVRLQQSDNH